MANQYFAAKYKHEVVQLLSGDHDFMKLLNAEHADDCIFDYDFTDETTADEKTFVVVDIGVEEIRKEIFTDFSLYLYIFTSKNLVRLSDTSVPTAEQAFEMGYVADTSANRIDVLCEAADRILCGTELAGIGNVIPAAKDHLCAYRPNPKYYGKCLKYNITNYGR